MVAAGQYKGTTYAIPWFDNPEGLFYRTDLIPTPPTTPAEVVSDAKAAMAKDPKLKEGLAFEGAKYEGAVTSFLTTASAFGGHLTLSTVNSPGNVAALKWLHDAIYVNKIAPQAVTGWQEGQVQQEFTSGYAAFAINYPFVASVAASGGPAKGHVGYIPFPAGSGGTPGRRAGWRDARDQLQERHSEAAWKLIQYLTSSPAEIDPCGGDGRPAVAAGGLQLGAVRQGAVLPRGQGAQRARPAAADRPQLPAGLGRPPGRVLQRVRELELAEARR